MEVFVRSIGLLDLMVTILILVFAGYFIITLIPFLFGFIVLGVGAFAVYLVYRSIVKYLREPVKKKENFDEQGHRITKASIVEMTESNKTDTEKIDDQEKDK